MKEEYINQYKTLLGAYYGVMNMDEYLLKVYVLKEIENYTNVFLKSHKFTKDFPYDKTKEEVLKNDLKTKLQDSLIVLNKMNADMELIHMIRLRLLDIIESEK